MHCCLLSDFCCCFYSRAVTSAAFSLSDDVVSASDDHTVKVSNTHIHICTLSLYLLHIHVHVHVHVHVYSLTEGVGVGPWFDEASQ